MPDLLKISHHRHSGRLQPHEYTSYLPLALLIIIAGVILIASSVVSVSAADPPPQAGSIGLTGTVPAAPPNKSATITSPNSGQHFTTLPIKVSGTCPSETLVEIYKNDIFAGSTPCGNDGSFSVDIDLLYGKNDLTARVYDVLNQEGPVSNTVTVYYDAVPPTADSLANLNLSGTQLLLDTDAIYRGSFPNQSLNVPVTVIGGTAPFAINTQWGDASNKIVPLSSDTTVNMSHAYTKAGTYKITLEGTDSQQQVAFLTVAAIINGQPAAASTTSSHNSPPNKLLVLWPLYAVAATLVASFWFGERREKKILSVINRPEAPVLGLISNNPAGSNQQGV